MFPLKKINHKFLFLTVLASSLHFSSALYAAEPYYADKRIEVIIPTSPGGGTDLFARLLADGFNEFLDGDPKIIPRQMIGGGGMLAGNWVVEQAPKDGTILLAGTGQGALRQLLRQKDMRTKLDDFEVIAAIPVTRNVFVAANKGVESREQLKNLQGGKGLYTALVDPIAGISFMLQAGLTDMKLKVIKGFEGGKDRDLAMLRGEIDIIQQISLQYDSTSKLFLRRGAIHLWNDGLLNRDGKIIGDKAFPDVPSFPEAYEQAFGELPSGELYEAYKAVIPLVGNTGKTILVSKDAPEEAKAALRAAAAKMAEDPKFSKRVEEQSGGYGVLYGEELDKALSKARDMSPELITFLQNYISARYEIEFEKVQ
ncbi:hypothetical protein NBRC116492_16110 [Aurantivibrio infirmus]